MPVNVAKLPSEVMDSNVKAVSEESEMHIRFTFKAVRLAERESQIEEHRNKINECREYDKVSKQKHKDYKEASQVIQGIIDEGIISDTHLRMLVNQIQVHQNKDKSLDIKFRMNGNWNGGVAVYVEPESEEIACS